MSSSDLRDRMDGLQWDVSGSVTKLETIMPGSSIITYSRGENVSRDQRGRKEEETVLRSESKCGSFR